MFKVHALFMSPSDNETIVVSSSPKKVVGEGPYKMQLCRHAKHIAMARIKENIVTSFKAS